MKKLFFAITIAVAALASCTKEIIKEQANDAESFTLTASAPGNDDTKTSLSHGEGTGWNVLWSEGDALNVKISGTGTSPDNFSTYTLESGAGTGNAVFRGTVNAPETVSAFYPKSLVGTINSYGQFFTIPETQTYSESGINTNTLPMYANGNKANLSFKHICSILRIPIYTTETSPVYLNQVVIRSTKQIAGIWILYAPDLNKVNPTTDGGSVITLDCKNLKISTSSANPTVLDIVTGVVGGETGDLEISFCYSDNSVYVKNVESKNIERGKIYKFTTLKVEKHANDLQINVDDTGWNIWNGSDPIGTPTTSVAVKGTNSRLAISSLQKILATVKNGTKEIDLDFSKVKIVDLPTIPMNTKYFYGNYKLKDVKLPEGIQELAFKAFCNCSVKEMTLSSTVKKVGGALFNGSLGATFKVSDSNPYFVVFNGDLYKKNGTSPEETYTCEQISCGKTEVTFEPRTTKLANGGSTSYCSYLKKITFPETISVLPANTLYVSTKLETIEFKSTTPPTLNLLSGSKFWSSDDYCAGYEVSSNKTIIVPKDCAEAYSDDEVFYHFFCEIAGYSITEND